MKQNLFSKMLAVGAVSALALSTAFAQTTTTKEVTTGTTGAGVSATTTTAGTTGVSASTTTSTSTLDGTGVITSFTPGEAFTVRTESSTSPVTYYTSKDVTVVDPTGAAVDVKYLRSDVPVKYTYVKQGDRMVVSKIIVQKPLAEITKETTTTTTTTTRK
jgi:hypothetical protein